MKRARAPHPETNSRMRFLFEPAVSNLRGSSASSPPLRGDDVTFEIGGVVRYAMLSRIVARIVTSVKCDAGIVVAIDVWEPRGGRLGVFTFVDLLKAIGGVGFAGTGFCATSFNGVAWPHVLGHFFVGTSSLTA